MIFKLLVASMAVVLSMSSAWAGEVVYRFSPVNQWDIKKTAAYWNPIIHYVSQKSGVKLELKLGRTSADTTAYVLAKEVEFVFSNHLFSPEREKLGWRVFGRRQPSQIRAVIAVPADSPIQNLSELNGQEVAFAGQEAFIGYKVPYAHLQAQGVDIVPVFGGNQNAAFTQLFAGKAKAVGSNSFLLEGYSASERKSFKVLWTSEEYHDLALMVASSVPAKDLKAVSSAFFQ